jgi:transcriptional regulator with XRE-family HTH domain
MDILLRMNLMAYLRETVLGVTQVEMARITGASQATVSRWERGEQNPDVQHVAKVREAAIGRNVPWDDTWVFEVPSEKAAAE